MARWLWNRWGRWGRKRLRRWAERWLTRNAPVAVPLDQGWIVLDGPGTVPESILLMCGRELEDERRFRELIRPGMVVFDVGGHLGIYTHFAASRVGAAGWVHTFEPAPEMFRFLSAGARMSGYKNVVLTQAAVSDTPGRVPMYLGEGRDSDLSSLAPSARRPKEVQVECVTLDGHARRHGISTVDLIKLDVEGAELAALRGAHGLLSGASPPVLQVELSDANAAHFSATTRDVKEYLASVGYAGYRAPANGEGEWSRVRVEEEHPKWENVFFLKPEHRDRVPRDWKLP